MMTYDGDGPMQNAPWSLVHPLTMMIYDGDDDPMTKRNVVLWWWWWYLLSMTIYEGGDGDLTMMM